MGLADKKQPLYKKAIYTFAQGSSKIPAELLRNIAAKPA